jgi:hypothetical protein
MGQPLGGARAVGRAGQALDFEFHQALGAEADHLAQEIGVGGLLQHVAQRHCIVGHRGSFGSR